MVILGKGIPTSLTLWTKRPNKTQKSRTEITDIANQYFMKFLKDFNNPPYISYNKKHVNNEPTEDCFLKSKPITKPIKNQEAY